MSTTRKAHILKVLPEYFEKTLYGRKCFEVRKNDRGYKAGDSLVLREWYGGEFTGDCTMVIVDYVLHGPCFGIEEGYCVMSIREPSPLEKAQRAWDGWTAQDVDDEINAWEKLAREATVPEGETS